MECFRWFNYKLDSYPHIEAIETIFLAIILPDVDGRELRAEGHETRSIGRGRQNCVALRSLNEREGKFQTYVDDQTATLTMLSNAAFVVGSEYSYPAVHSSI